jgi:hypothetical protein
MSNFTLKGKQVQVEIDDTIISAIIVSEPQLNDLNEFSVLICLTNNRFMVVDIEQCKLEHNVLTFI